MTGTLVSTALAVSVVILIVLVVRGPAARHFGARAAYALWLAPLARALWPLVPSLDLDGAALAAPERTGAVIQITQLPPVGSSSLWPVLLAVWAAGAGLYLAIQVGRHHLFVSRALARGTILAPRGVPYDVVASDCVEGPVATGLIHPIILVPTDFGERFTPEQQRLALLHEQSHHRRGDIWASATALGMTAALWFNPFAHLALSAFRRDMEAACDSSVVARANPGEATAYAETILRCASRPVPRSLCALTSIDELKGRLNMLTLNHGPARRLAGVGIAALVVAAGLATPVFAIGADEPGTTQIVEKKIIRHGPGSSGDVTKDVDVSEIEKLDHHCDGPNVELSADGGAADKKQAMKMIVCADKGSGNAGLIQALTNALAQMDKDNAETDPALRAEMKSKMEAKLKELRNGG